MRHYLVRHGEATIGAEGPAWSLSGHGREEVRVVALHAAAAGIQVAQILHSGTVASRQTAEVLAEYLRPARGVREHDALAREGDTESARYLLHAATEPLMIVGDLPNLSLLASALLVGAAERDIVSLLTGAMACLERTQQAWRLEWLLTPELAGALELSTGAGGDG
jgi:phosphohistidine phosphatase SixA